MCVTEKKDLSGGVEEWGVDHIYECVLQRRRTCLGVWRSWVWTIYVSVCYREKGRAWGCGGVGCGPYI